MAESGKARGRPKTLDRPHTIEVAMECYWREGVHALGLNEICRRTGLAKPVLYREFGGEDGLMAEALDQYWAEIAGTLLELLSADRPFFETLEKLVRWATEDRGKPVGCLFVQMRTSPARLGPVTTKRVAELREELRAAFSTWYEGGLARKEVNPAIAPGLAAAFLDTQLMTILMQRMLGESPDAMQTQASLAFQSLRPAVPE